MASVSVLGKILKGFGEVAAMAVTALAEIHEVAETIRRLKPLGHDGWAISTYGLMLAKEVHHRAAIEGLPLAQSSLVLEEGWSDGNLRKQICSMVPWVYRPEDRAIGHRRQELLERASDHFSEGRYEEAVLLVYTQVDGLFHDRAVDGEAVFSRLFSKRSVRAKGANAREFAELVAESKSMAATEREFFLVVRDQIIESVGATTLADHPSRHGVLHGRVLGFGTRRRAAQAFAFLAAALEMLVASWPELPLTTEERRMPVLEAPPGLRLIMQARAFSPVRGVYLGGLGPKRGILIAVEDEQGQPSSAS